MRWCSNGSAFVTETPIISGIFLFFVFLQQLTLLLLAQINKVKILSMETELFFYSGQTYARHANVRV